MWYKICGRDKVLSLFLNGHIIFPSMIYWKLSFSFWIILVPISKNKNETIDHTHMCVYFWTLISILFGTALNPEINLRRIDILAKFCLSIKNTVYCISPFVELFNFSEWSFSVFKCIVLTCISLNLFLIMFLDVIFGFLKLFPNFVANIWCIYLISHNLAIFTC